MNRTLEALLTLVALAALYSAVPASVSPPNNSEVRAEQNLILADGSDPMPLCRTRTCTQ